MVDPNSVTLPDPFGLFTGTPDQTWQDATRTEDPNVTKLYNPFGLDYSAAPPSIGAPATAAGAGPSFGQWLQANSTVVIVLAGALFVLAIAGGRR